MDPTTEEIIEKKKTLKGKYWLWKAGIEKFKSDPPIYRIHMMQGLMTKLTIYMIVFAAIYAISIGFWVFALIILPVGTIGNFYGAKGHMIKYKETVNQYEIAGILKPINEDISKLRRKWRIVEKKMGFLGVDIIFTLFLVVLTVAYFGSFSLWQKFLIVGLSFGPFYILYFVFMYGLCERSWRKNGK